MTRELSGMPQGRIVSVDVLRGFDMFWIIGGEELFRQLLRMINTPLTDSLAFQFEHSRWNGFTFYDLIFPLFLFVVGISLSIALGRRLDKGMDKRSLYIYILKRFVLLMVLGLIYNGLFDLDFAHFRYAGVLQRIAICYLITAVIFINTSRRVQYIIAGLILVVYWGIMVFIPVPGFGAGVLTPEGNLAGYIDRLLLPGSFCCYGFGDNEGILSTLPAITTTLLGVFTGYWLLNAMDATKKTLGLGIGGAGLVILGWIWGLFFPINKLFWSSSYVLFAAGWSVLLLALFYWIVDVRGMQRWAYPFVVIGLNPITIYVVQSQFDFGSIAQIFIHGFVDYLGSFSVLFTIICVLIVKILFLHFLHKHKIYLRA